MGDEHLDTIPAMKSDEFIKYGVETLIPIPSESEGIPDHRCDVPSHDDSPPLDVSKDQFEDFSESNEEFSLTDDDSFSFEKIDYVEASPPDSELVSSEAMEIVIPKVGGSKHQIDCVYSIWTVKDKILVLRPPKNCARCTRCGYLVDGPNCQGCALLRQELEENLVTRSLDFQNTFEPSNASTNVVNAPREPYVVKQVFLKLLHKVLRISTIVAMSVDPDNSFSMGDEHLDTIPATKSDEFIKYGVETLIPIPSESEGIPDHRCDVPSHDDSLPLDVSKDQFEDFSKSNEEFSLTDDDSFSFEKTDYVEASPPDSELVSSEAMEIVIPETKSSSTSLNSLLEETNDFDNSLLEFTIFSKVLCDAEYESDFSDDQSCSEKIVSKPLSEEEIIPMESLRTHDSSLLISSKIDSLLDEFAGELALLKSIPPGIDETDCDPEEDIRFIEKLLYDNSSPRPPEEFVSANSDAKIKSFSPSPILVKDSDSLMEEIDLFYGDTRILNIKMMGDISDQKSYMHKLMITLTPYWEKSPDLLSHRCGTVKKFNTHRSHLNKCPMLSHGQNNPLLDVLLFHFYPL
nr:hypothetical protein [Tanacetum cinerariifolium]